MGGHFNKLAHNYLKLFLLSSNQGKVIPVIGHNHRHWYTGGTTEPVFHIIIMVHECVSASDQNQLEQQIFSATGKALS